MTHRYLSDMLIIQYMNNRKSLFERFFISGGHRLFVMLKSRQQKRQNIMENYKDHAESANFLIKVFEFIIAILCGLAFIIVLIVSFYTDSWKVMWPALVSIPCSCLGALMILELGRHVYLSFVYKTDYYKPYSLSTGEHEEYRQLDSNANNQDGYK